MVTIDEALMPMLNDSVKCIYNPENHNKARQLLIDAGFEGNIDELLCNYMGGDAIANHVMVRAIQEREKK